MIIGTHFNSKYDVLLIVNFYLLLVLAYSTWKLKILFPVLNLPRCVLISENFG